MVLSLDHAKFLLQVGKQLLLGLLLAHHGGHLLAKVAHDQNVNLSGTYPLDELVHLRCKQQRLGPVHTSNCA